METKTTKLVGIVAAQGDFAMHARILSRIGAAWKLLKHPEDFAEVDALILPGGESTTILKFLSESGAWEAFKSFSRQRKPIFGTCAGAILLAKEVLNPSQASLNLIDISIERNAYGRQIESAIRQGECPALADHPLEMVFIRAPVIRRVGKRVKVLGRAEGLPVLVEQGHVLAATFHPELTADETIHRYFLKKMDARPRRSSSSH